MGRYLGFSVVVIFILVVSAASLLWFSVETQPRITMNSLQYLNSADDVSPLLKQIQSTIEDPTVAARIDITHTQINSIQALLQRSTDKFRAKNAINNGSADINMTYIIEINDFKRFINLQITIGSGDCLLYTSPSPRDLSTSRMPSSA